jgi:hypothetical protein
MVKLPPGDHRKTNLDSGVRAGVEPRQVNFTSRSLSNQSLKSSAKLLAGLPGKADA